MPIVDLVYSKTYKQANLITFGAPVTGDFTRIVGVEYPPLDPVPCAVEYHGIREALYRRSSEDPALPAPFPDNIHDMAQISIGILCLPKIVLGQDLPKTVVLVGGDNFVFEINALGGGGHSYAWYKDDVVIAGETSDHLYLQTALIQHSGAYKCRVRNTTSGEIRMSRVSKLIVTEQTPLTAITSLNAEIALSMAEDAIAGKTTTIFPVPTGAKAGTLSVKTPPPADAAIVTIFGSLVKVVPISAGPPVIVVITNGVFDYSLDILISA